MTVNWRFPGNGGGQVDGFNASGIAIFAGNLVQSVVREVLQNSLDARNSKDNAVKIRLNLAEIPNAVLGAAIDGFKPILGAAQKEEERIQASIGEGRDFYVSAQKGLRASTQKFLVLQDANTKGLNGPVGDSGNEKDGGWNALVKGNGKTVKHGGDNIGSFGQGSKAPFALSNLRTVFYLTKTTHNDKTETRFQGKSILQSFRLDSGEMSQGTGFFGHAEDLTPLIDDQVPEWALNIRNEFDSGTGTSLFVAAPYLTFDEELNDFWFRVRLAVLANFYYAIKVGNLSIELGDETKMDSNSVDEEFDKLMAEIRGVRSVKRYGEDLLESLESVTTIRLVGSGLSQSGESTSEFFGDYKWFARVDDGDVSTRKVGIARATGMLITRQADQLRKFKATKPFDMFVCVTGETGSEILRAFENPEHNKFEFDRVRDESKRREFEAAYTGFALEIKTLIEKLAGYEVIEEAKTSDLNHLFSGDFSSTGDEDLSEFTQKIKIGTSSRRFDIIGEAGQKSTKPGGQGVIGGKGVRKTRGGSLPGPGEGTSEQEATSGIPMPNVRFIVDPTPLASGRVKVLVRVRSVEDYGPVYLAFNKVGEIDKQRLNFGVQETSTLETKTKSRVSLSAGEVKDFAIYIEPSELKYGFEAVAIN
jgi:hypothetical protein